MKTYIVKEGKKLKIIKVLPDQESYFQADYAGKILVWGNNTMEALLKYGELPELPNLNDEASPD